MTPRCDSVSGPAWWTARSQIVLGACACAAASAFVYAVDPRQHAVYPTCALYQATGIYCAGCGATRAVFALLHGRGLEALHDNVLLVAALPLLLYVALGQVTRAWRINAWPSTVIKPEKLMRLGLSLLILILGFMVLRNLPGLPFSWLRPE